MPGSAVGPSPAAAAATLCPAALFLAEAFAATRPRDASFDLVIGNIPFGNITLTDRRHNSGGHSIHNHFIIKSLHLTRPGGIVALLTSRFTMDAQNPAARREIAALFSAALAGSCIACPPTSGEESVAHLYVIRAANRDTVRADLAEKIARLVPGLSATEQEQLRRMTPEVLTILARDQVPRVRRILAETLKDGGTDAKGKGGRKPAAKADGKAKDEPAKAEAKDGPGRGRAAAGRSGSGRSGGGKAKAEAKDEPAKAEAAEPAEAAAEQESGA